MNPNGHGVKNAHVRRYITMLRIVMGHYLEHGLTDAADAIRREIDQLVLMYGCQEKSQGNPGY